MNHAQTSDDFGLGCQCAGDGAFASWNITVLNSSGVLNPPSTVVSVPTIVTTSPLPQITFLTGSATPSPILVGDGTPFTNGTFSATYSIAPMSGNTNMFTGFNFVIAGVVDGSAMIVWQKKVIRNSDNAILYNDSGMFAGSGFGGADGAFSVTIPVTLSVPANDVTVYETFQLGGINNATSAAALLLVEQDWTVVPEPASLIALATGLGGILLRRRRN